MAINNAIKILTKNISVSGYTGSLDDYRENGGYRALEKVLKDMKPEEVIAEVKKSELRGRGGAGFPTGQKWSFLPKETTKPIYLVCNADESEPGTFKDRLIIERDPHLLIEGMIIAAYAIKAHTAYLYIRGEFAYGYEVVKKTLTDAYKSGYLGKNILNSGFDCDIYLHQNAGMYICGEETGLLESLEGKRGWPRSKPPFPAVEGAFKCPTIVNNVETLSNVPFIIDQGGETFAKIGVSKSSGTRLFCLSGHINKPGVYEYPMGITMRELIYDVGGGIRNGRLLKGVIPGGISMPILTPQEIDISLDFDSLKNIGSSLGSCGIIVMDDSVCMVDACLNISTFFAHESCGQCTPCREGMPWLQKIINRIEHGKGENDDLGTLIDIARHIEGHTICPFGEAGSWPVQAFLKKYKNEFEEHIRLKRCPMKN